MTAGGHKASFEGDESVIKSDYGDSCTTPKTQKPTELYHVSGRMVWRINYTAIKLLKKAPHTQNIHEEPQGCVLSHDSLQRRCKLSLIHISEPTRL